MLYDRFFLYDINFCWILPEEMSKLNNMNEDTVDVMNKYIDVIIDYMKEERDYAYLLDGAWGSGKTFFVNHTLKESLEKEGYKLVHVSLFGKTSVKETNNETLLQVLFNSDVSERINKLVMNLTKNANSNIGLALDLLSSLASFSRFKNKWFDKNRLKTSFLYVFDDLERCDKKVIPNILGEIHSQYTEKGYHVLLVADESKLSIEGYREEKEKLIRNTLKFSYPDMSYLISEVIKQKENTPIFKLFSSEREGFNDFVQTVHSVVNIRTWLASFDYYNTIVEKSQFDDRYPYYMQLFCLVFLTTHYMHLDEGFFFGDADNHKKLEDSIQDDFHINAGFYLGLYSSDFYERFESVKQLRYVRIEPIVDYIKSGFCDVTAVEKAMEMYFHVLTEEKKALIKSYDDNILSQKELEDCIDVIWNGVINNKNSLEDLVQISVRFEVLEEDEYLKLYNGEFDNYKEVLIHAVDNISRDKVESFFDATYIHKSRYEEYMEKPNFLKEAIERVKSKYVNPNAEKERFVEIFNNLDKYSLKDIEYSNHEGTIEKASKYNLFSSVLSFSCKSIAVLNYYLTSITDCSNCGDVYGSEIPYLKELSAFLDEQLKSMSFSKEKIELTRLNNRVKGAFKKLEETKTIISSSQTETTAQEGCKN